MQKINIMKYEKHIIDKIKTSLENGDGRVRACKNANISYETFIRWYNEKSEFNELVKKAEDVGNDKIKDLCKRKIIEDKSWQSGAWWLERTYPDEYKNRSEQKVFETNLPAVQINTINTDNDTKQTAE